jgi:DNA topoisomerase-1
MPNAADMIVDLRQVRGHARVVGLRHVSGDAPGIQRRRCGGGFSYRHADGTRVADPATLARIRSLVIPPAYVNVWICAHPDGHLQATGYDAAGRKQYRYHPRWQAARSATKYTHILEFATALPQLRRRVGRDLKCDGLVCQRILATAVRVLDTTLIRIGNARYTAQHGSFGLTTLQNRHVRISRDRVDFNFIGKSKQKRRLHVDDPVLARILRRCRELPGHRLFEYIDAEGQVHTIDSADVNDYLHEITGHALTAKDFRTWGGTVLAAVTLAQLGPAASATATERNIVAAIKAVAARLGNRPATSRKYYVHPAVLEAYRDGTLAEYIDFTPRIDSPPPRGGLLPEEKAVLALLRDRAAPARGHRRLAA